MSQVVVERTLGKLVTDVAVHRRSFRDPAAAGFRVGLDLSRAEIDALSLAPLDAIERFSECLDHRICRCVSRTTQEDQ